MSGPLLRDRTIMATVCILQSLKDKRTYVGSTNNFDSRITLHNLGRVKSTKHRIPLKVLFTEEFKTIQEAKSVNFITNRAVAGENSRNISKNFRGQKH